jgi:hypothetical protein
MRSHRNRPAVRCRLALLGAVPAAAVAAGCGERGIVIEKHTMDFGGKAQAARTWVPSPDEPITLKLEAPPSVRRGEEVPIRVIVRNGSQRPVAVGFGQTTGFNVLVARAAGRADSAAVWSLPVYFTATRGATVTDPLQPGRDTVFTATWPGIDDRAQFVPPGSYRIRATVSAELVSTKQLWSEWTPITVKP